MKIPVLMGPTGSGKSAAALRLAEKYNGEIISADSMQLYRGLDVGTAKPTHAEQVRIRHHLIDTLDLSDRSDLFAWKTAAEQAIIDIRSRGKLPVVEGGTGLYLRALIYGLDNLPADETLRAELNRQFDGEDGLNHLRAEMAGKAPDDLARWSQHPRKLIRAYEVFRLTGKSITSLQKTWGKAKPRPDLLSFFLCWDRDALKERIARRVAEMLENGWIDETAQLAERGLFSAPTAWQALGYPIVKEFLDGKISRSELPVRISTATWQYARRQLTWFRGQHPEAVRIDLPESENQLCEILEKS